MNLSNLLGKSLATVESHLSTLNMTVRVIKKEREWLIHDKSYYPNRLNVEVNREGTVTQILHIG